MNSKRQQDANVSERKWEREIDEVGVERLVGRGW